MFPCSSCGLCCKNISKVQELKDYDLGNGVCKYFDNITNGCKIYETRPDICRIDKMFKIKYYQYFTIEEFYIENANVCNNLQEQYSLDQSYRIIINKEK